MPESTRLPAPTRTNRASRLPTPRRTVRTANDVATQSGIPTPRRLSSNPESAARRVSGADALANRRVSAHDAAVQGRRASASAADSSIPAPRRLSQPRKTETPRKTVRVTAKPDSVTPVRPGYRRASGTGEESRRLSAPRYGGTPTTPKVRESMITPKAKDGFSTPKARENVGTPKMRDTPTTPIYARENATTPKVARDSARRVPDRPAAAAAPSPAATRRVTAPRLNPSPYARRSSGAGSRTVTRKINMGEERRVSGGRFLTDRIEKRRESGGKRSMTALESFRAARRASLEGEEKEGMDLEAKKSKMDEIMEDIDIENNVKGVERVVEEAKQALGDIEIEQAGSNEEPKRSILGEIQPRSELPLSLEALMKTEPVKELPDRADPVNLSEAPVVPPRRKTRRASARFADVDICLDNVDRLRTALGRRRSYGLNEGELPETPTLRRTSLGRPTEPRGEKRDRDGKRASVVPSLDDDDLGWANEDVEDLGVW